MRNLLHLMIRYHFTLLFIIIEVICLSLVVQYNSEQRATWLTSASSICGSINSAFSSVTDYLSLKQINEELLEENARLKNELKSSYKSNKISFLEVHDSVYFQQYVYTPAKTVRNSINRQHNYLTIDKGSKHGIKQDMGVVSPSGVIGIVRNVSRNYSTVIPLLNTKLHVSGRLKESGYFGAVNWDGNNYREVKLLDIPFHVELRIGEEVVTSGYSAIFPEGIKIGVVKDFSIAESENFYDITIELSTDFKNLSQVHVVSNLMKEEQRKLEEMEND